MSNVTEEKHEKGNGLEISLNIPPIGVLSGLFASSIGYAFLLNTKEGRRWNDEQNWFVVMVGVMLTLIWLSMTDPKAAIKAFICFIVSGIPIIARSLIIDNDNRDGVRRRSFGTPDGK